MIVLFVTEIVGDTFIKCCSRVGICFERTEIQCDGGSTPHFKPRFQYATDQTVVIVATPTLAGNSPFQSLIDVAQRDDIRM